MDTLLLMVILDNAFGHMLVVWNNTFNLALLNFYAPVIKDQHLVHLLLLVMSESALPVGQGWTGVLYADDPLWDGLHCISDEVSC